jgi:hypothetical protein
MKNGKKYVFPSLSKGHQASNLPLMTKQDASPLTPSIRSLPLATKQYASPLTSKHWISSKGHQAWNLPFTTKLWSCSPFSFLFF